MADATAFSRAGIKSIHGPASRRHLNPEPLSTSYRQVPGLSSVSHPGSRPDEESGNASDLVPLSPGSRDIGNSKDENSAPNPWLSIPPKNGNLVDPAYEHLVDPANGHLVDFVNGHLVDPGGVFAPAPSSWAPLPSYYYTSDGGQWSPYPRFSSEPFLLPPSPVLPTGDRPFKCDQCSQSFQRKHDLNRHKRIHLAIKPFPCTHCDKEFSRKDALKRHKLSKGCGRLQNEQTSEGKPRDPESTSIPLPRRGVKVEKRITDMGSWSSIDSGYGSLGGCVSKALSPQKTGRISGVVTSIDESSKIQVLLPVIQRGPVADNTIAEVLDEPHDQSQVQRIAEVSSSPSGTDSSQSSGGSSSVTGETLMAERRREVVDRVVQAVTAWLRSRFSLTHCQDLQVQGNSSTVRGSSGAAGTTSSTRGANNQANMQNHQGPRKRKVIDGEDDEQQNNPNQPPSKTRKGKEIAVLQFACPYFKYNRIKYKSWRGCPGPGWPDVHRVKHRRPRYRCGRCWQPFEDENSHVEHQRIDPPCPVQPFEPIEGFDAEQEKRLKSRKKAITELDECDKWKHVFRILFPHVDEPDIPSPFYDYESDFSPNALSECEEYIVKEVPLRLRRIIEPEFDRDLSIVEQGLKRKAIDSLKTLLVEAFREFRQLSRTTQATSGSSPGPSTRPQQLDHLSATRSVGASASSSASSAETNRAQYQQTPMTGQFGDHMNLTDVGFEEEFDMAGLDLDFLTDPESFLGEGPFIETLLQSPEMNPNNYDDPADKRFSDSGYDSTLNSPP